MPPSVSTTCWAKTSGALMARSGSPPRAICATASSSRAELRARRRPTRSGTAARRRGRARSRRGGPTARRAAREAQRQPDAHRPLGGLEERARAALARAPSAERAEPALVDRSRAPARRAIAPVSTVPSARRVGWPARQPVGDERQPAWRRRRWRSRCRRRSGRGTAASAPTPARRWRRAARRCRSRGSRRRPRSRAPSARAGRGAPEQVGADRAPRRGCRTASAPTRPSTSASAA